MTIPSITPLPPAPSRADAPDDWVAKADARVAAESELVGEINAAVEFIEQRAADADQSAQSALAAVAVAGSAEGVPALLGNALKVLRVNAGENGVFWDALQMATSIVAGVIEIATSAEHIAGTSDSMAVVPSGLAAVLQGTMMTYVVGGGSANAHTAMYTPEITTLSDGMTLRFRATAENTGAATFAPNGMAAKPILSASLSALTGGEIKAGSEVWLQYSSVAASWIIVAGNAVAPQPLDATLTALAAVATAADKLIYATGADAFATTALTAFARTLLSCADDAAICQLLGTIGAGVSYSDMTGLRAFDTIYTSGDRWRFALITPVAASSKTYSIEINGSVRGGLAYGSATVKSPMFFGIPPRQTYRIVTTGTPSVENWQEA